jgi:DNA polymerase-3 subunit gamma/tau
LRNFCRDLLAYFRDLMVVKVSGDARLLETSAATSAELKRHADLFSESDLVRFFHSLAETENKLKDAAHPRYQVEVGLVKLMEMRRLQPLAELVERISALENSLRAGGPITGKGTPSSGSGPLSGAGGKQPGGSSRSAAGSGRSMSSGAASFSGSAAVAPALERTDPLPVRIDETLQSSADTPANGGQAETSSVDATGTPAADTVFERLRSLLDKRRRMFLVAALDGARRVEIDGEELCVEFAPDMKHLRETLLKADSAKILREVCLELTGREIGLRFSVRDTEDGEAMSPEDQERREQERLRASAEQHPAVQQLLKTFRGEIVDVKRVSGEQ